MAQPAKPTPKAGQKSTAARTAVKKPDNAPRQVHRGEQVKSPPYLQAKLLVSSPGDAAEKQADAVAGKIARARTEKTGEKAQRASLEPVLPHKKIESVSLKGVAPDATRRAKPAHPPLATGKGGPPRQGEVAREAAPPAAPPAGEPVSHATEKKIEARRGTGGPLPQGVAEEMEERFAHDFEGVRIHTDEEAADLCSRTKARAFTVGHDIFFAPGEFAPGSEAGHELLAHELTHVLQQTGGPARVMRQNAAKRGGAKETKDASQEKKDGTGDGILEQGAGKLKLRIPKLDLPAKPQMADAFIKKWGSTEKWTLPKAEERGDQIAGWKELMKGEQQWAETEKKKWFSDHQNLLPGSITGRKVYALRLKKGGGAEGHIMGSPEEILEKLLMPWWNDKGESTPFDVDHILELQLGGAAKDKTNFQLLDASANRSSGSLAKNALERAIVGAIPPKPGPGVVVPKELAKKPSGRRSGKKEATDEAVAGKGPPATAPGSAKDSPRTAALDQIKDKFEIVFDTVTFGTAISGNKENIWSFDKITKKTHLEQLEKITKKDPLLKGDMLRLFPRHGAGKVFSCKLVGEPPNEKLVMEKGMWGQKTLPVEGAFDRKSGKGTMNVDQSRTKKGKTISEGVKLDFASSTDIPTICHVLPKSVVDGFRYAFNASTLSPIELSRAEMDAGADIAAGGKLTVDGIPILGGTVIDIFLVQGDLIFSKTFATDDFNVPGPIEIDSSSLTLSAALSGEVGACGEVSFHMGKLARGLLKGTASPEAFCMGGELELERELFTGSGRLDYHSKHGFSGSGTFKLKPGALKGVKGASVTVAYDQGKKALDLAGDAELALPGFKGAKLSAHAEESGEVSLAGEAQLSEKIPRVKGGKLTVSAQRTKEKWAVTGSGELEPSLPGLDDSSRVKIEYRDGILSGKCTAGYKRALLAGKVDLNARGDVGGEGKAEPLKIWGGGQVDVTATRWLKATANLALDEKGHVSVGGQLGLPAKLDIFPQKKLEKSLLSVMARIPVFPGVVAEVGGNLGATASVGPGSLERLAIGMEYSPDEESTIHLMGDAHLNIPADAGMRLGARAGIGLGIVIASATGGLDVGGTLGIAGAAEAAAHIDWTPQKGLAIDTEAYLHAQPRFLFDINGYINVQGIGLTIYDKKFKLKEMECGSNLQVGARFPIRYREGQNFDVSMSDVKLDLPDLQMVPMLKEVGKKIF